MTSEPLSTAPLVVGQAEEAFALSSEAGWNQTVADWRLMIATGEAWGQMSPSGELVATTVVLPYAGRVAWIGMVLTTAAQRRRGLATHNLHRAIDFCATHHLVAGLDATPAGREVYLPLGFHDVFALSRFAARAPEPAGAAAAEVPVRKAATHDLEALVALDAEVFGAARPEVIRHLLNDQPALAHVAGGDGGIDGAVLGRRGRIALHLGPVYARTPDIAAALVAQALRGANGPVSIDVPDGHASFVACLERAGFAPVRPFTRMLRGDLDLGDPERAFAIAGPEIG